VIDLTLVAVPGFFATMELERRYLRRRDGDEPSQVTYTRPDTRASLTMGVLSVFVPLLTVPLARRLAPQRTRAGKVLVAVGIGAVAATTVADAWAERSAHAAGGARKVSRLTGPTAVAALGVAATAGWATATATERFWRRGARRDLGGGLGPAALAIAGWDFLYYWNHRLMHETRAMWAFHVVHHSSQRYNLSTALRQPVAESLGLFAPYGLMSLGGIRPAHVELARGVNLLYQYWFHTDAVRSLGPLEKVLNTASHHRVHHASNQRYIDRNHGSILIVWDRLFGTFAGEDAGIPVVYGLTKNIDTYNPWTIATKEYADILRDVSGSTNWRDRLSFVARGPGWSYRRHALASTGS
jgi:sterol desaturase/sphingolipid hydroxylase (fatty acid hydroxylase superfamily)